MRSTISLGLALLTGCGISFSTSGNDVSTTKPTEEQVAQCRDVMYINPEIEINPVGYALTQSLDDVIRFKFIALTDDPTTLFDATHVDSTQFAAKFNPYALNPKGNESWWDLSSQELTGANFSVPSPNSSGTRGLNVAFTENDDKTLTVYVLWHET